MSPLLTAGDTKSKSLLIFRGFFKGAIHVYNRLSKCLKLIPMSLFNFWSKCNILDASQFHFGNTISTHCSAVHIPTLLTAVYLKSSTLVTLALRPQGTTIVPYANSLDPDETPSNSASHLDPSCLTMRQTFLSTLSEIEAV